MYRSGMLAFACLFFASGCLGGTARERKVNGAATLVAGVAVMAVGASLTDHEEGECREGPGYAPGSCFGADLTGAALGLVGITTMTVGVANIISGFAESEARPEGEVELVAAREIQTAAQASEQTACAQWQSAYDSERDPNRRASLRAAAPAHCSSFLPSAH